MGVLPHSIFNLFFLYFGSTRVGDAVVKIFALISQSPCISKLVMFPNFDNLL